MRAAQKMKAPEGVSQGQQGDEFGRTQKAFNCCNYKMFSAKSKQLFLEYPTDTTTAETLLWMEITGEIESTDQADRLTQQLMKWHPENQSWRKKAVGLVQQERQQANERREINRKTGGKVVFLVDRLKKANAARRAAIIESCHQSPEDRRKTLAVSLQAMLRADRDYWSEYTKLALSVKRDWKAPEDAPDLDGSRPLIDRVLSGREFMAVKYDKPREIVAGVIKEKGICMVHGGRGIGKTQFITNLALSASGGTPFFCWGVNQSWQTLVIDAEMASEPLQARYYDHSGGELPEKLDILCSEPLWLDDEPLNLAHDEGRERINKLLTDLEAAGRKPDLIILDNKSALIAGMDENDNSALDGFLRWLIQLRHKGHAVLLVHHQGKGGQQRGASRLEDPMDTVISLEPVKTDEPARGARFTITFTKCRGERPTPDKCNRQLQTILNV